MTRSYGPHIALISCVGKACRPCPRRKSRQYALSRASEKIYCSYVPGYSYALGIRCPKPGGDTRDYGWDGAAGALMGIIPALDVSFYYAQHVLSSPNHELRKALPKVIEKDL